MHHRTDRTLGKKAIQRTAVAHVAADEYRRAARQLRHPVQRPGRAVAEVVEHHHVKACLQQRQCGVGADVAGAAGDQYFLAICILR